MCNRQVISVIICIQIDKYVITFREILAKCQQKVTVLSLPLLLFYVIKACQIFIYDRNKMIYNCILLNGRNTHPSLSSSALQICPLKYVNKLSFKRVIVRQCQSTRCTFFLVLVYNVVFVSARLRIYLSSVVSCNLEQFQYM